jgi:hypothetical protein
LKKKHDSSKNYSNPTTYSRITLIVSHENTLKRLTCEEKS